MLKFPLAGASHILACKYSATLACTYYGVADALTTIDGKKTAVDVKYDKDWNSSIRNSNSKIGQKSFNKNEQNNMIIYLFILY